MGDIGIYVLVFSGIVATVLLVKNKPGGFKFGLGKDIVNVEVNAAKPPDAPAVQSEHVTTQNIHYGLDEAGIKKLFEDQQKNLLVKIDEQNQKLIESGTPDDQVEINLLQQELAGVEAKLSNTKKALKDREKVLAETEKALENEKLKNVIPADQLAEAKQKLEEGDASALEELFSQYIEEKQSRDEPWAEVAFSLGKLAYDRIDHQTAQQYYEQAVQLAPDNALYLNQVGFLADTLGQYDKARDYYEKALQVFEKAGLPHRVQFLKDNIAEVKKLAGR